jgi:hypothetical protein
MADFTPKKVSGETGPGIKPKAEGSMDVEHQAPPVMHLEAHHIQKLFKNKMPPIGSKIPVHAVVHVGAYSEDQAGPPSGGKAKGGEGNAPRSMTLHFHKMDMGQEGIGEEDQAQSQRDGAKAAIDKALTKDAGKESAKGKPAGKTPAPRGGQD